MQLVLGVVFLLLAAGSYATHLTLRIRAVGWGEAPTWLLLVMTEVENYDGPAADAFKYRVGSLEPTDRLLRFTNARAANHAVHHRRRWPAGHPIYIYPGTLDWFDWWQIVGLRHEAGTHVDPTPQLLLDTAKYYERTRWREMGITIDPMPDGEHTITVPVSWYTHSGTDQRPVVVETRRTIQIGGSLHDVITPILDDEMTQILRETTIWSGEQLYILSNVYDWRSDEIAVGLKVELLYRGEVQAEARISEIPQSLGILLGGGYVHLTPRNDGHSATPDINDPDWQVRVTGDGAMALRDPFATHYWAGTYTLSLPEAVLNVNRDPATNTLRHPWPFRRP